MNTPLETKNIRLREETVSSIHSMGLKWHEGAYVAFQGKAFLALFLYYLVDIFCTGPSLPTPAETAVVSALGLQLAGTTSLYNHPSDPIALYYVIQPAKLDYAFFYRYAGD